MMRHTRSVVAAALVAAAAVGSVYRLAAGARRREPALAPAGDWSLLSPEARRRIRRESDPVTWAQRALALLTILRELGYSVTEADEPETGAWTYEVTLVRPAPLDRPLFTLN
jgi:hypothetical protein